MPRNVTPAPIADLVGKKMAVSVGCEDRWCSHSRMFSPEELIEALGQTATYVDIIARLRCSQCGRRPGGIQIISVHAQIIS